VVLVRGKWLANTGKTPKGTEPQERKLLRACLSLVRSSGARAVRLWRGAKGQERRPENVSFRGTRRSENPMGQGAIPRLKGERRTDTAASCADDTLKV